MVPVSYNLRNLMVRKTTTAAAAGGLALVVFVLASVLMLGEGIQRTLGRSGSDDVAVVIRKGSEAELSSGIEDASAGIMEAMGEVRRTSEGRADAVREVVIVILLEKLGTEGVSNVTVRGVPGHVLDFRKTAKIIEGRPAQAGTEEVVVGKSIAGRFKGLAIGQTLELKKNRPVKVVGIFADEGSSYESEIWADLDTTRAAFGREGSVSSMRVRLADPSQFDAFKASVESNRQLGFDVMREPEYYAKQSEGTSMFITALGVVIAFFFSIGAMIGATITMYASVANRSREIGTLRALGFSKGAILLSFLIESLLLALLGGVVGVLAALPMSFVKFSTMNFASSSEIVFSFEPTPGILLTALVVSSVMGVAGGFLPAIRAARVSPIQAIRG
jgi:putative ABC transport system permease protein